MDETSKWYCTLNTLHIYPTNDFYSSFFESTHIRTNIMQDCDQIIDLVVTAVESEL